MIVCIPSKGRPSTKTYKLFEAKGTPVYHFCEPQEVETYEANKVPNVINIGAQNRGISYVRNFILDFAKNKGEEWIIMCDDDILRFYLYKDKKNVQLPFEELYPYILKAIKLPFEMVGFNYKQYIWVADSAYSVNTRTVEQCVLLNVKKISWRYRPEFDLKEDRDFALQTIKNGNGIFRWNRIGVSSPEIGSNDGGLNDDYAQKRDQKSALRMVQEWHPFCELKKKKDRWDIKMKLKELAIHHKKQVV